MTVLAPESTDTQYPSAKTVYDFVRGLGGSVDELIAQTKSDVESDIKGGASSNYNTLKKTEDAIKAEAVARQEADSSFDGRVRTLEDNSIRYTPQTPSQIEQAQARTNLDTYSKAEVNQIATAYTAQNYVTVQAVAATTDADIPTLINATGNGEQTNTLYRVGWFDGTAFDVTKYSEYTWNGTDYVQMAVRSSIGEVFDISVYNATGGTPAQYETLALALGTNGANVPEGVRQGGMSVKFIQSSDNKYVQYLLTKNSWSASEADWEKMNLEEEVNLLNQKTYKNLNVIPSPSYEIGHFYYNGTNKGDGASWECAIIPIDGVTHLLVKTNMFGDSANCCITDASDNVLVSWKQADLVNNLIDVDLSQYPSASKLYFSVRQYGEFVFSDAFVYGTKPLASKDDIATIEEEISDINAEISGATPIDSGELVAGLVTTSSAPNFVSGGSYRTTDFLPVNTGDKIVAKCAVGTSGYSITCYSSNTQSSYVAETGVVGVDGSTLNDYEIIIPVGVNYIRVSTESAIEGFDGTITIEKYSDGIISRIEKLEVEISGQTIILVDNAVLINTKGGEQASGGRNYWSSDFIPVSPGQSLKIDSLTGGTGALLVSFYTTNTQNSFSGHGLVGDGTLHKIVNIIVPNGVSYMRLCSSTGETGPLSAVVTLNKNGERLLVVENIIAHKTLLSFKRTSPRLPMVLFQMDMASAAYNPTILDYMNILSANGIKKSTYNVLPQFMGADAYKNFDVWMNEIYSNGNEVALHTDQSYVFNEGSSLTPEQIHAAMVDYLTRMKAKGYDVTGFIPLGANLKPSFKPIVQKFSSWMLSGTDADPADVNPLEPNVMDFICGLSTSPYAIKRVSLESMQDEYTEEKDAEILQVAKDVVDATITNGGYVIFYAHTYNTTSGTTYTLRPGVLEPLCQYIKQKIDNMEIVTGNTNEMLEWYYSPRVND